MPESVIGPYQELRAVCVDHDRRAADVARRVAELVTAHLPALTVEHIGSTAVPGCAGKGVVDLMIVYRKGRLQSVKDVLEQLGFQRQTTRDPFPEDRPMRVGSLKHEGKTFQLHVHVIAVDSAEAAELRAFRDRLRVDPELRAAYVTLKRAIIVTGVTDAVEYCERKSTFFEQNR